MRHISLHIEAPGWLHVTPTEIYFLFLHQLSNQTAPILVVTTQTVTLSFPAKDSLWSNLEHEHTPCPALYPVEWANKQTFCFLLTSVCRTVSQLVHLTAYINIPIKVTFVWLHAALVTTCCLPMTWRLQVCLLCLYYGYVPNGILFLFSTVHTAAAPK